MTRYEKIMNVINDMNDADLVALHNEYCEADNRMDDYVYSMNDFDEIMSGRDPWEIARCCFYGDFCPAHDWFNFNGYANLDSFDYIGENTIIDRRELGRYVDENENALFNSDLLELFAEIEEREVA